MELVTRACVWWGQVVEHVRRRLQLRDEEMTQRYERKRRGDRDIRFDL